MATQQTGSNNGIDNTTNNNGTTNNSSSRASAGNIRQTRIRKACDICRMRKVKCDGISPCKQCQSLGAECTFQYVSRHRGPTSRFAAGSAWSAQNAAANNAAGNTNGITNATTTDDSQDVHILNGHDDFNTHHSIHGHTHGHTQNHGFTDDNSFDNASDFFASLLMTPQPMNLPQSPAIPDSLNTSSLPSTLGMYRNDSGIPSSSLRPRSPSSVASGNSIPSVGSTASPSVQSVPYSSSFFDAVATNSRRSPAAPPVHLSSTHTPHINIYPRMPRPQLNRQAVPPPPPPPPPANPQHQFPPLPPLPLQFHHAPQAAQPQSKPPLNSDAIAPLHVLELLVDDFFTYIHPLIPFPHEPTFRRQFSNPDTRQAPGFLALLASMIGCLAASFPRSVRAHLKARASATSDSGVGAGAAPFTRAVYMVACCRDVALAARGAAFYTKPALNVDDAATSYFLGLAAGYTFDWHLCRRFMAEAMSFVQELGFHRRRPTESDTATHHQPSAMAAAMAALGSPHGPGSTPRRFNHVEDQIGKRIFWILYLAMRSLIQLGATLSETPLPPFNNARPFPDLPAEVDDAYIEPDVIHPQPAGTISLITGFNKTIQIYATMDPIATMEYACGLHQVPVATQRAMFVDALKAAKLITSTLPHELYLPLPGSQEDADGSENTIHGAEVLYDDLPGYRYYPPECDLDTIKTSYGTRRDSNRSATNDFSFGFEQARATTTTTTTTTPRPDDLRNLLTNHPARRRQVQYDIQKTNIYASQLATRSYYVEMYLHLGEDIDSSSQNPMYGERERIVHSLLFVLAAIPQCNMEPNGSALINKIRQVASTLLSVKPKLNTGGDGASAAEAQLMRFLEILMRLERTGGPAGGVMAAMGVTNLDSLAGLNLPGMTVGSMASMASMAIGGAGSGGNEEEEELQSWASLREEQMRFAANGGFLGHYSM
ncbi:hypothetical protein Sste5344_010604 [Sporothrix stenoceras]